MLPHRLYLAVVLFGSFAARTSAVTDYNIGVCANPSWKIEIKNCYDGDCEIIVGDSDGEEHRIADTLAYMTDWITYTACDIEYIKPHTYLENIDLPSDDIAKTYAFRIKYNDVVVFEHRYYHADWADEWNFDFWANREKILMNCYDASGTSSCVPCPLSTPKYDGSVCRAAGCAADEFWTQTSSNNGNCAKCPAETPLMTENKCTACGEHIPFYHAHNNECVDRCCPIPTSELDAVACGYTENTDTNLCEPNTCQCTNGVAAVAGEVSTLEMEGQQIPYTCFLSEGGRDVCASCDEGFSMREFECLKILTEEDCEDGSTLENNVCKDHHCTCANGYPVVGNMKDEDGGILAFCPSKDAAMCGTCLDGFQLVVESTGERKCVKKCMCENGVAAETPAEGCPSNNVCQSCKEGYRLTSHNLCGLKQCSCDHGTGARGIDCPHHLDQNNQLCTACDEGWVLFNGNCVRLDNIPAEPTAEDVVFYVSCDPAEAANCHGDVCMHKIVRDSSDVFQKETSICVGDSGVAMTNMELLQSLQSC